MKCTMPLEKAIVREMMTDNVKLQNLEHWHRNDTNIKLTLEQAGKNIGVSRTEAIKRFRAGDTPMTEEFWRLVWSEPDNRKKFNRVNFCTTCQKFEVYFEKE